MTVVFRRAAKDDIPAIVSLLKDDELGKGREVSDLAIYEAAFEAISAEPGNVVIVGVADGKVVATYLIDSDLEPVSDGDTPRANRRRPGGAPMPGAGDRCGALGRCRGAGASGRRRIDAVHFQQGAERGA